MKQLIVALFLLVACQSEGAKPQSPQPLGRDAGHPAQTDITAEDYVMPALPQGRVTLLDAFGGKHPVEVEVASNRNSRTRGLMWRKALADGKGMLFIFPDQQPLSFWMRNTLIPLDMIFIDQNLNIVGAVENAEPKTTTSRGVGGASKFVLEVPGGYWAKHQLKAGQAITVEGIADVKVEP